MPILTLTRDNFDDVIATNDLVLIDFSATWCQPCLQFEKVLSVLAPKHPDIIFGTVDIEKEPELAEEFKVISIPAVMMIKSQVVVFADSGLMSDSELTDLIKRTKHLD